MYDVDIFCLADWVILFADHWAPVRDRSLINPPSFELTSRFFGNLSYTSSVGQVIRSVSTDSSPTHRRQVHIHSTVPNLNSMPLSAS